MEISNTAVSTLKPLRKLRKIEYLDIENTKITSLEPIHGKEIMNFICDGTPISFESLLAFIDSLPELAYECLSLECHDFLSGENLLDALKAMKPMKPKPTDYPRGLVKCIEDVFDSCEYELKENPKLTKELN